MKIIQLKSENVKKIKAIEITPKDNVVIISGKNGQGKTSVLDSIWYALEGRSLKNTPKPIREGESKAEVTLTIDDIVITRKWTANNKTYLKVTNKEGLSYNSPQELLDSFIGKLTFDPLEFAQMKDNVQRDLLLKVTDLNIDKWDNEILELREKRRIQGQQVKMLSGEREEITLDKLPNEFVSISKLQEEYEKGLRHNQEIEYAEESLEESQNELMSLEEQLREIQQRIKQVKGEINETEANLENAEKIDTDSIKAKINNAENINNQIRAKQRNDSMDKKQKEAQKIYDDFTEKINKILKAKEEALAKAKMPIEGLGISETGVTYKDIPFSQLSSSEQLKISLSIAIALNPKLKVIRITDGSLLDDDNMKLIKEMATNWDYQVWIERVNDQNEIAFIIEDGEIKGGK
jgi:recombinational DNA repair ATPase RecF